MTKYLDRSEAVNLARNLREHDNIEDVTRKGIMALVEAVLRMDEELKRLYSLPPEGGAWKSVYGHGHGMYLPIKRGVPFTVAWQDEQGNTWIYTLPELPSPPPQ